MMKYILIGYICIVNVPGAILELLILNAWKHYVNALL